MKRVMQFHSILLAINDKGIIIEVNPFSHEQYPFDNLGDLTCGILQNTPISVLISL
jgi:hypothetical protein